MTKTALFQERICEIIQNAVTIIITDTIANINWQRNITSFHVEEKRSVLSVIGISHTAVGYGRLGE